jgi:hypothetical protein
VTATRLADLIALRLVTMLELSQFLSRRQSVASQPVPPLRRRWGADLELAGRVAQVAERSQRPEPQGHVPDRVRSNWVEVYRLVNVVTTTPATIARSGRVVVLT